MIGQISGILLLKTPPELLIDVNGVGYEISAPMTTIYDLPEVGQKVQLFTHLVVREDVQQLYGFKQPTDRHCFRQLIKVNGVGPKLALTMLSAMNAVQLIQVIQLGDAAPLVKIPGIGKKTAERLVIELRDVAAKLGEGIAITSHTVNDAYQDALAALITLGYKETEVRKTLQQLEAGLTVDQMIKGALQRL